MFLIVAQDYRFALALVKTVFFIIKTKLFNSKILFYNLAKIDGLEFFWKYWSIVGLAWVSIRLYVNKINYKYLK